MNTRRQNGSLAHGLPLKENVVPLDGLAKIADTTLMIQIARQFATMTVRQNEGELLPRAQKAVPQDR